MHPSKTVFSKGMWHLQAGGRAHHCFLTREAKTTRVEKPI